MRISWVIGGAQGTGIDTAANIFGNAIAAAGYYVFGNREYNSNIKGRHSYFSLTISDKRVRSITESIDILVSYDADTIFEHFQNVKGTLIYNPTVVNTKVDAVQPMWPETVERVKEFLSSKGYEPTVKGVLDYLKSKNVELIPVNYDEVAKKVADQLKIPLSVAERVKNIAGIAVSFRILGLDANYLIEATNKVFKQDLYKKMNAAAVKEAYELASAKYNLKPLPNKKRYWLDGNTAAAIGKIYGGLRFQSYYPITPAADESMYMEAHMDVLMEDPITGDKKKGSVVVVQAEDELAAINMAIGAALTGVRAATATSGPGFSLMVEGMAFAGMIEAPVVITYYIRAGPSTGMATRTAQSDVIYSIFAGHGEFPKLVIASGDHAEVFKDSIWALNLAEKYQTLVIHLVEKTLANSYSTVPEEELELDKLRAERGKIVEKVGEDYVRFKITEDGISPRAFLGQVAIQYTSDEHNEEGHISEDPVNRTLMYEKRMKKLETADKEIPEEERVKIYGEKDSKYLVITWGSPTGALRDILEESNLEFTLLQIRMFSPFPKNLVSKLMEGRERIITVEGNYLGQTALLLRMYTGKSVDSEILKWNGRPILKDELENALIKVMKEGEKRVVLNGGA